MRVYLAGSVQVELGEKLLGDSDFGGRQGRLALVYLALERERAVTQGELAEVLWPESLPSSWPVALSAVVSRLRSRLGSVGLDRDGIIANAFHCYQLRPPPGAWVDLEVAAASLHLAEGAVQAGRPMDAYGSALIATTIVRRPFLAGEDAPWIDKQRARLQDLLVRALDCRVESLLQNGETALALDQAREAVRLEPFREPGYRRLMQVLVQQGDRAEAVRVYEECRRLLRDELGVSPSGETEALMRSVLA